MKIEKESHGGDGAVGQDGELTENERNESSKIRQFGPMAAAMLTLVGLIITGPTLREIDRLSVSLLVSLWLFIAILWGAIGVMRHAEAIAEVLGEPLGTLILTFSAITVEIALIMSVMLEGERNPALARDTMFATLMIVLNGLLGLGLLLGGVRHRQQTFNLEGARAFLIVLVPLAVCALVLPNFTKAVSEAALSKQEAIVFSIITLLLYAVFVALQTSRHRNFFAEEATAIAAAFKSTQEGWAKSPRQRRLVVWHSMLLLLTLIPVALLAEDMALFLEKADHKLGWPEQLIGVIIASLVLAPEGLSGLRAAWNNHLQRSVNILMGTALSTIALTVPTVLIVGAVIGHDIILGLPPDYLVLLFVTLFVTNITLGTSKTDTLKGAVHLVLFFIYLMLIILD
jgi:Ca2+:H+ antiporter